MNKVHLNVITHVETTPAQIADADLAVPIHEALKAKGLPPGEHLLDSGEPIDLAAYQVLFGRSA